MPIAFERQNPAKVLVIWLIIITLLFPVTIPAQENSKTGSSETTAQSPDDSAASREQQRIANAYLKILQRNPRPGTALDRLYAHHVQTGSFDKFISTLKSDAGSNSDNASSSAVILGLVYGLRGNDDQSVKWLEKASSAREDDPMASFYYAKSLSRIGKLTEAIDALKTSVARKPKRADAVTVFETLARNHVLRGQNELAIEVWEDLEKQFPGDRRIVEQIAKSLALERQYEEALKRYERLAKLTAAENSPREIEYRVAIAEMKRHLSRDADAIKDFESILARVRPGSWLDTDVRARIETIFLKSGSYSSLADYYEEKVKASPDKLALRMRWGYCLQESNRTDEAIEVLRKTTKLSPDDTEPRLALVRALSAAGRDVEAAVEWKTLVEQQPGNPDFAIQLGQVYLDDTTKEIDDRRDAAEKAWLRLADFRKDDPVVVSQVADLMRGIGRDERAISLYRKAISLAPESPQYREYLGEFLHLRGRSAEAMDVWKSIASEDRGTIENWMRLAEVYRHFKKEKEALEALETASKMDMNFSQRLRYAFVLTEQEKYDDALKQLDIAKSIAETDEEVSNEIGARIDVFVASDRLDNEITVMDRLARKSGKSFDFRVLARMHEAAGQLGGASAAMEMALQSNPDDIDNLVQSAALYRKISMYDKSVETYKKLIKLDRRFQVNYLKQIASIQAERGQFSDALKTADELIAAQPKNPDSYLFAADLSTRSGNTKDAINRLRKALAVSSRDRDTQFRLAELLADDFQTQESIALHWQLMTSTEDLDERVDQARLLAKLHQRRGDTDRLIERLEMFGRERRDDRLASILMSAAYQEISDYGAARTALQKTLDEDSKDVALLEQLVTLSSNAGEMADAAKYQDQLTKLSNTPDNRSKLIKFLYASGQSKRADNLSLENLASESPDTMLSMIDSAISSNDHTKAVSHCQKALQFHPDQWEIRTRLMALSVIEKNYDEALKQIELIDAIALSGDTPAIDKGNRRLAKNPAYQYLQLVGHPFRTSTPYRSFGGVTQISSQQNPSSLLMTLGVQPLKPATSINQAYINYYAQSLLCPSDVREAKFIALMCRLAVAKEQNTLDATTTKLVDPIQLKHTKDIELLQKAVHIAWFKDYLQGKFPGATGQWNDPLRVRIALLDKEFRNTFVNSRLAIAQPDDDASVKFTVKQKQVIQSFSGDVLDIIAKDEVPNGFGYTVKKLCDTLVQIGDKNRSQKLLAAVHGSRTPQGVATAMEYSLAIDDESAQAKAETLALEEIRLWATDITTDQIDRILACLHATKTAPTKSDQIEKRFDLVTSLLALKQRMSGPAASSSRGSGSLYVRVTTNNMQMNLQRFVPYSSRLLPPEIASTLEYAFKFSVNKDSLPKVLRYLDLPSPEIFDSDELNESHGRMREVLSVYAHWWNNDVATAKMKLTKISDANPDDPELWIERSRLAAALGQSDQAMKALESIRSTTNQRILRDREMATMNLALKTGDKDRARKSAERLFAMRLGIDDERYLQSQLKTLGLAHLSSSMLHRAKRRSGQSVRDRLALADQFIVQEDLNTAGEIAFEIYQRVGPTHRSTSELSKVVSVLKQTGRFEKIIEQAEKRVESAPKSFRLRNELAEIYRLAGRRSDADRVFHDLDSIATADPADAWKLAVKLTSAKQYDRALVLFAAAIEKRPEMLGQDISQIYRAANTVHRADKIYEAFAKTDTKKIPPHIFIRLIGPKQRRQTKFSDAGRAAVKNYSENCTDAEFAQFLRSGSRDIPMMLLPSIQDRLKKIYENDSTYDPNAALWDAFSGGSSLGVTSGFIDLTRICVRHATKIEPQLKEIVDKRISKNPADEMAQVLSLALDCRNGWLKEMRPRLEKILSNQTSSIPASVWWDVGSAMDSSRELSPLAADCYWRVKTIQERSSRSRNPIERLQFGVDAKLINSLVTSSQKIEARQLILGTYRDIDKMKIDANVQSSYSQSRVYGKTLCAERLRYAGWPLDAIGIYSNLLQEGKSSVPELSRPISIPISSSISTAGAFTRTVRASTVNLELELSRTIGACNTTHHEAYLKYPFDDERPHELFKSFRILPLKLKQNFEAHDSSFASLVMHQLAATPQTIPTLQNFADQAAKKWESNRVDWQLLCGLVLAETNLIKRDSAVVKNSHWAQLNEWVSNWIDSEKTEADNDVATINILQSVALVGLESKSPDIINAAAKLTDHLIDAANVENQRDTSARLANARLVASKRIGDRDAVSKFLAQRYEAIVNSVEPENTNGSLLGRTCLEFAEKSIELDDWEHGMKALKYGFRLGPPLRQPTSSPQPSISQAFTRTPRTVLPTQPIKPTQAFNVGNVKVTQPIVDPFSVPKLARTRSGRIVKPSFVVPPTSAPYSYSINSQLTRQRILSSVSRSSSNQRQSTSPTIVSLSSREVSKRVAALLDRMTEVSDDKRQREIAAKVYDCLSEIIFPSANPEQTFPYTITAVTPSRGAKVKPPNLQPQNLSRYLAKSAILSGNVEKLNQLINWRMSTTKEPQWVQLSAVMLAIERDAESTEFELKELMRIMKIPAEFTTRRTAQNVRSKSADSMSATHANLLCQAVIPAHAKYGLTPAVAAIEQHLLHWAATDSSIGVAEMTWYWMVSQTINSPEQSDGVVTWMMEQFVTAMRRSSKGTTDKDVQSRIRSRYATLARDAVATGRGKVAGEWLHQYCSVINPLDERSRVIVDVAVDAADSNPLEKYEMFFSWCIQNSDRHGFQSIHAWNHYAIPPPILKDSVPSFDSIESLAIASDSFPITSTALMLAENAARSGKTDELIKRLDKKRFTPKEDAKSMIGLALLADGQVEKARSYLNSAISILTEGENTAIYQTSPPMITATFFARAAEHKELRPIVSQNSRILNDRIKLCKIDSLKNILSDAAKTWQNDSLADQIDSLEFDSEAETGLMSGDLPGWASTMLHSPMPQKAPAKNKPRSSRRIPWYIDGGLLKNLADTTRSSTAPQRHIHRILPMGNGQSVSYEFMYRPGDAEVHPTIGRIAILLKNDQVKLRWLLVTGSNECYGMTPTHEVDVDSSNATGKLNLWENEWNRVKVTRKEAQLIVEVNEEHVATVDCTDDMRFGLVTEKGESSEVRKIELSDAK